MRQQLIQYVDLLFAGADDCEEIKQEILQNTLDRYDDLITGGKSPEAAYRLAISGIGDINEILGNRRCVIAESVPAVSSPVSLTETRDTPTKKLLRAIAVGLYILCPLPLIVLGEMGMDVIGLCGTLCLVAVATVLIMLGAKKNDSSREQEEESKSPRSELRKSISGLVWAVGLAIYFILSFATAAWHITWVIFPILGALDGLLGALISSREAGTPHTASRLSKGVGSLIWAVGLALYFLVSFTTFAWHITWLIFPITGAVQGLARAIFDLKEAISNEN